MPPTPPSSPTAPLEYASAPPRWRKRIRWVLLALVLISATFCAKRWGPYAWHQSKVLYWQRQCMNFSQSPDTVVYDEDPTNAGRLLHDSNYSASDFTRTTGLDEIKTNVHAVVLAPGCLSGFINEQRGVPNTVRNKIPRDAVLFLHGRISPAGHHRLVSVIYLPALEHSFDPDLTNGYNCEAIAISPATWSSPPTDAGAGAGFDVITGAPYQPPMARYYAGQADPNDASHFTIRYQMWGQEDVLDGRLRDDDQVALIPRHSPKPQWQKN